MYILYNIILAVKYAILLFHCHVKRWFNLFTNFTYIYIGILILLFEHAKESTYHRWFVISNFFWDKCRPPDKLGFLITIGQIVFKGINILYLIISLFSFVYWEFGIAAT